MKMIWPCCKTELPAPLEGVAIATCSCGLSYDPKVIIEYNEMREIITDWGRVINRKALIKAEPGQADFVSELILRGIKYIKRRDE